MKGSGCSLFITVPWKVGPSLSRQRRGNASVRGHLESHLGEGVRDSHEAIRALVTRRAALREPDHVEIDRRASQAKTTHQCL